MKHASWSLIRVNPVAEPEVWQVEDAWTTALRTLETAERARRQEAQALADDLYELVPLVDAIERRCLLHCRRSLHASRPVTRGPELLSTLNALSDKGHDIQAALGRTRRVLQAQSQAESAREELAAALEGRRTAERAGLREVLSVTDMRRATALSSPGLARTVDSYVRDGARPQKRARKHEGRLLRFAERAIGRTSPFSTYTIVGRAHWATGTDGTEPVPAGGERVNRVEVNRVLLLRLLDAASRHPLIRSAWPHQAARVVRRDDDAVVLEQHLDTPEQQPRVFATQTARTTVRRSALVDAVLDLLSDGRHVRPADLALSIGGADPRARQAVDRLLAIGLVIPVLPVDDHVEDPVADARHILAAVTEKSPPAVRVVLGAVDAALACLDEAVTALASAPSSGGEEAAAQVEACDRAVEESFAALGQPRPAAGFTIYEDVVLTRSMARRPEDWSTVQRDLECLVPALPAFDNLAITRAAIRSSFVEAHGEGARRPLRDLVELLPDVFSSATDSLAQAVEGLGRTHPQAAAAMAPRATLADQVRRAGLAGQEVLELDRDWAASAAAAVPAKDRHGRAYAVFLQRTAEGGAVLNNIYGGRGQFASRFLDMWGESALREVREWVAEVCPPGARELRPVQGFNANVHPPLLEEQLHTLMGPRSGHDLGIDDLTVVDDPAERRLRLQGPDGEDVEPIYLGLLVPFLLPYETAIYYVLGDSPLVQLDPAGEADDDLVGEDRQVVRAYPRVVLGSLVLSRRVWAVPAAQIPLPGPGTDPVAAAADLLTWRLQHGIPEDCFVTAMSEPAASAEPGETLDAAERWRTQLAALTAKPLRVRWGSPLHVSQLHSWFGEAPSLWITETLPAPGSVPGEPTCTEHVFEMATEQPSEQHLTTQLVEEAIR
ncbi:lantibiotic dehydratase [Ornithinimicrobium pratense]|nr:lantibiotic dehydratase [Ornithinimicrobium pratense]